jgi:acetyl esterase/lipase
MTSTREHLIPGSDAGDSDDEGGGRASRTRRVIRLTVSVLAVCWMVLAVIGSIAVVAPSVPYVGLAGLYVNGYATQLFVFGLVGAVVVVALLRLGGRRTATVTGVLVGVTIACAAVPTAALMVSAHRLGAPVSLPRALIPVRNVGTADPTRTVRYATVDGADLNLDVWLPTHRNGQLAPAVVFVHGGGFVKGSRSETPQWNRWLNDAGYAVFDVGYRLAPPARWDTAAGDVACALAWLGSNADRYGVDPGRVALGGRSAGGNLALRVAYTGPGTFSSSSCGGTPVPVRSVFALYPPVDLVAWWQSDLVLHGSRQDPQLYTGGTPSTYPDRYAAASPIRHVRPGLPPTLLVAGASDQFVPAAQSAALHRELDQAGVPNQFVALPFADHDYDLSWNSLATQITQHVLADFLHRNLAR